MNYPRPSASFESKFLSKIELVAEELCVRYGLATIWKQQIIKDFGAVYYLRIERNIRFGILRMKRLLVQTPPLESREFITFCHEFSVELDQTPTHKLITALLRRKLTDLEAAMVMPESFIVEPVDRQGAG